MSVVGQEALDELGSDTKNKGADHQSHIQGPSSVGINDPVEDDGENKEGDKVQHLIVDILTELERRETGVGGEDEE